MWGLDLQREESVPGLIFYFRQNKIRALILFFLNSHEANSGFTNPSDGVCHRFLWEGDTMKDLPYKKRIHVPSEQPHQVLLPLLCLGWI